MSPPAPLRVRSLADGRIAHLSLAAGKGNVLGRDAIEALSTAFEEAGRDARVRAVLLTADGPDFSWGASVPEHAAGEVERMLPAFTALFRTIARSALPVAAAVHGRCLGGGLELALAAQRIFVAEDALLGLPEVGLAVFPPVAAAVLPLRLRQPEIDRLVGLGEMISGIEAVRIGLADEAARGPEVEAKALAWCERWAKLSGVAVRFATRAARAAWDEALDARLPRLERLYLEDLMATRDAREGIASFVERRSPVWTDQ
jgi:cyclohexa-1,5-dienecarbonyl-CoA hydratase